MPKKELMLLDEDGLNAERERALKAVTDTMRAMPNVKRAHEAQLKRVDEEFKRREIQPRDVVEEDIDF